ncbi:zinc metallopeptidase [Inquilinus limosus]|uniref:KPN_02809 family neutral zinc metallopeptidase n=1 Tax=Inquilinus limosus TaxID=171674 RepID=UPI003F1421A5
MRWRDLRRSSNVEDRRGMRPAAVGGVGGIGAIVIVLLALFFGVDPSALLQQVDTGPESSRTETATAPGGAQDEMSQFLAAVLGSTEDTWGAIFQEAGSRYAPPKLIRFAGSTRSACGFADAAMGPFYCPADQMVYIDTAFFDELGRRFGAPGEFAEAYVVAHEVGHHVQNLLGIMDKVNALRSRGGGDGNELSVRVELQADCFAGVWAKRGDQQSRFIEPGDVEAAMRAAAAVGDDTLQKRSQGYVVPDSFTHGSAEQRVRWFRRGYDSGSPTTCDTFSAQTL